MKKEQEYSESTFCYLLSYYQGLVDQSGIMELFLK